MTDPQNSQKKNPPLPEIAYLDPGRITVLGPERLDDHADRDLTDHINENTQLEPIICTRQDGQIVLLSGLRRLEAARAAGLDVLAVIHEKIAPDVAKWLGFALTAEQRSHSYIERALWVRREVEAGRHRDEITAISGVHYSEISRMLALVNALPEDFIRAIGRAPEIGRRRWRQLADAIHRAEQVPQISDNPNSNARFRDALAQIERLLVAGLTAVKSRAQTKTLFGLYHEPIGQVIRRSRSISLIFKRNLFENFANWIEGRLPILHQDFIHERRGAGGNA